MLSVLSLPSHVILPRDCRCHRVLGDGEAALPPKEQALLDRICDAYYLPAWCSIADYERLMRDADMQVWPRICDGTTKRATP